MDKNSEIDNVDLKILSLLMDNAGIAYTDIAKEIFVSPGTVHVRMKKLEQLGIVKGSHLSIDYARLGYDVTAFLGIYLEKSSFYDQAVKELQEIPEVVNVHYTTGNYSMFVKIICKDTQHLRQVLHDKIQKVSGIQRTETSISLEESINRNIKLF
ncbi:MAG: Lrp/AsnC ligand binding domain-containing protein [Sporocytophaga sp.]|jgi:Lrp/AsnC family transcriptional regulator for asnA, asnC and gidA|uniref:Lrp/AsnC ligand binding domain-containing protein n=1 Tax=Sporocytophaga sp. TaxID=2231183 RepID=UPI001B0046E5|nr:Lrp/AsnC ligand binding domain-containing protein [Sporocytophaga sp.]MBO9701285.1 Lrp/AsnC ligand binding domain-containing protein [Sporocytophaga sp.]MCR6638901.1 Lrp/AsnC ligand binding domain-containing protein [Sporocytophaga sp.]